jgi:hypothetical protein
MQRVEEVLTAQTMFTVYDVLRETLRLALVEAGVPTLVDPMEIDKQVRAAIQQMSERHIVFRELRVVQEEKPLHRYTVAVVHETHNGMSSYETQYMCRSCMTCICHDPLGKLKLPCSGKPGKS